jgi:hypothetical protein
VAPNKIVPTHGPYNQNPGTLPNVLIKGCLYTPNGVDFGYSLTAQNKATFTDLADGVLDTAPWICDDGT